MPGCLLHNRSALQKKNKCRKSPGGPRNTHISSIYCVPGSVLDSLYPLSHLKLTQPHGLNTTTTILIIKMIKCTEQLPHPRLYVECLKYIISLDHHHLPVRWKLLMFLHVEGHRNSEKLRNVPRFTPSGSGIQILSSRCQDACFFGVQHPCLVVS